VLTVSKKVCLLGDFAVGKTSLVRRLVYSRFDDKYISTIGVKVSRKTIAVAAGNQVVELTMMLWDLASSAGLADLRTSYLRGAAGAILVGDITRPDTFSHLADYARQLLGVNPAARFVMAAKKVDLADQAQLPAADIEQAAQQLDAPLHYTSAKDGREVDALLRRLADRLLELEAK
jgi:small GTP-binding protein